MTSQKSALIGERVPFSEACKKIINLLVTSQKPYSISGISREVDLHRQTVLKCLEFILSIEKPLEEHRVMLDNVDDRKIVSVQRKTGLLSYPEHIQRLIIKMKHFPEPSRESRRILYFYLNKALSPHTSKVEEMDEMIDSLVKEGQVKKTKDGRVYLSDEGIVVAKGVLKAYPELESELK